MKRSLLLAASLCAATFAQATEFVWDGGSVNNSLWSNNVNWKDNLSPVSNILNDFTFGGTTRTNVIVDSPYEMNRLKFKVNAGAFTIAGADLTIGAGGIANRSGFAQSLVSSVALAADQDWKVEQLTGSLDAQGSISGNFGINKTGQGTLTLSGLNSYTGSTTVSAGTLQLGRNFTLPNGTELIMNGGTLDTNGYSDYVGSLTLTADSTINFGSSAGGDSSMLLFAGTGSWTPGATLTITGWNGNPQGGNGADQLIFVGGASALNATQLSQIKFLNPDGMWGPGTYDATILASGEVVPVPEPATVALGTALLGLVGADARRRKLAAKKDEE